MGILGMRFFISSSFERKGMGFHEAFFPKKFHVIFFIHYPAFLGIPSSFLLQTSLVYFLDIIEVFICRQDKPMFPRVEGKLSSLHFLKYLNLMFVFKFCAHFGGPVSTASGLIFTLLRVQRSDSLPPLLCVLCDC
ncbi:hypothetical protein NC652_016233 [Populus alba x Populus x berolinensis]|nr:hypothetical protein NC652_016233 [Populus alba x Populus x berolinensis]